MELVSQHTKNIMEGCKERARAAGLCFDEQTLEYIVTNRDLLELSPKLMIPTLYDYWVQDVEVLKEKGKYELYPSNPYETVINTRPAVSFYNDNNPDWLNVMIFYHVLAHIDFFQNNLYFKHTWDFDFSGQALSDKRMIANLRSTKGRWVDYVIEFARGIDNLVGFFTDLSADFSHQTKLHSKVLDYYFDVFLQIELKVSISEYVKEIERYNQVCSTQTELADESFLSQVKIRHPEFDVLYKKYLQKPMSNSSDLLSYISENSHFLRKNENSWMKSIVEIVRKTSLFFQPQIRTKIMNEGWASYWHEKLFMKDDRINGHEVEFARINAGVTSLPLVGLNPYALGMRLFQHIEEVVDKGKYTIAFDRIKDRLIREDYDQKTKKGHDFIFALRENYCDFTMINDFVDQDFITRHNLFVAGRRLNKSKMVWEYYIKSRKAIDYKTMLIDYLYHPPYISVNKEKTSDHSLYLVHHFEQKSLVSEFIHNTMLGIEYLWGGTVQLETHEPEADSSRVDSNTDTAEVEQPQNITWTKVLYTIRDKKLIKEKL